MAGLLPALVAPPANGQVKPNAASNEDSAGQLVPAADKRFLYEGRMDFAHPAGPMVVWAGSRIRLDFEGSRLALRLADATGQNFFNAEVDGVNSIVAVGEGPVQRVEVPLVLGPGRHHLVLFKRSEAAKGQVRFLGVELAAGAQAWAPELPAYQLKIEFIGDSITVGACNEDGAIDQWKDFRTHNHALSYDHLTSQAFRADHRAVAVSGMGIVTGWTELKAGQAWDRLYPRADAPRADLSAWQPDVAFVLLGENDDSFPRAHGLPFPAGYSAGLVTLVKTIRMAYPHAQLVLLRGGMYGGAQSGELREAWTAAVQELEAGDAAVSHFVFTHWSSTHPRVSDARAMADELTAWLKRQPFMKKFL
jgi:lysophospholipase L1-like esterase